MVEKGVIFGRFQMFHMKHMEYLLAAKMRCRMLYIGITHSDITAFGATSPLDVNGITRRDNPMTYLERMEMIQKAAEDFGIWKDAYEIIPFPITQPDLIAEYAPKDATYFMNICGKWDEEQYQTLKKLGLRVEVLMRKAPEDVTICSSRIRELITEGKEWKMYVPKAVGEYITSQGIDKKIRALSYQFEDNKVKEEKAAEILE